MRMGIADKKLKGRKKTPLFQSDEQADSEPIVVSQVSSNLIDGIYSVQFTAIAENQAELYAQALLNHEEQQKTLNETTDQENSPFPSKFLFSSSESRQDLRNLLTETATHFYSSGRSQPWKVHANAAKFERSLNEKYGRFRPIINKYPQIETFLRKTQRSYSRGEYSPFRQGDPPFVDKKSSIILLFMMHRNGCQMETVVLTAIFFLVGLQPWALVLLVILGRQLMEGRKKRRVSKWVEDPIPVQPYYAGAASDKAKYELLNETVGELLSPNDFKAKGVKEEDAYDTLIVGSGPATMYTAALLSRTGKAVLVLSPDKDASGVQMISDSTESQTNDKKRTKFENVAFDIHQNNVAHTSRQQELLAPALSTTTDAQGGIRFAEIGSPLDGYTSDLLSIPGVGVESIHESTPYAIRAGQHSLAEDAAFYLGDAWPDPEESSPGKSTSSSYLSTCDVVNTTSSQYYLSKLLPTKSSNMIKTTSYQEASVRYASGFLDSVLPLNSHVRSLMAGIGMRGENLPPSKASMAAHISHASAFAGGEGFTYPIGGPRALCKAFESVVKQNGGRVVTNVRIKEFVFNEGENVNTEENGETEQEGKSQQKPRCHGVLLVDGRTISVGDDEDSSVISMLGFIPTFIFHMEDKIRSKYGIPAGIPSLEERRPLLHFLIGLNGNSDDLCLTGADWYRLPNASLAIDEKNPESGEVVLGTIGKDFSGKKAKIGDDAEEANKESGDDSVRDKRTKINQTSNKELFKPGKSWMKISFPSAKDPSWRDRHGDCSACVVTVEADDSFVRQFETSPKVYSNMKYGQRDINLLLERVTKDLLVTFPQLNNKIELCRMIGPERVGLSHTPQRYAAKGIRPETPYPGLFVGGSDLTVGDSFSAAMVSGWMVSNAVLGYSFIDLLYLDKNITNDLKRFMKPPKTKEEDLAVPLSPKPIEELISKPSIENKEDSPKEQAAEPSKEE